MREVLVLSLVYIAAVYVGPTVASVAPIDVLEWWVSLGFVVVAFLALHGNHQLLAAGYVGHGVWDAVHGPLLHAALPAWYAPMCLGFDWVVAIWILFAAPGRPAPTAH